MKDVLYVIYSFTKTCIFGENIAQFLLFDKNQPLITLDQQSRPSGNIVFGVRRNVASLFGNSFWLGIKDVRASLIPNECPPNESVPSYTELLPAIVNMLLSQKYIKLPNKLKGNPNLYLWVEE